MNVLLDTHALIWWLDDDRRLSRRARRVIADADTVAFVSTATAWEIATKVRLGKLANPGGAVSRLGAIIAERGMTELPITFAHALAAGELPGPHRDPFDRMLIAQGKLEGLPVVTSDPVFPAYNVEVVW